MEVRIAGSMKPVLISIKEQYAGEKIDTHTHTPPRPTLQSEKRWGTVRYMF
jgi:hypothetical protein